jgi:hypothetical protein
MKRKLKVALLGLSSGMIALQLFNCARFLGDFVADRIFLSIID